VKTFKRAEKFDWSTERVNYQMRVAPEHLLLRI